MCERTNYRERVRVPERTIVGERAIVLERATSCERANSDARTNRGPAARRRSLSRACGSWSWSWGRGGRRASARAIPERRPYPSAHISAPEPRRSSHRVSVEVDLNPTTALHQRGTAARALLLSLEGYSFAHENGSAPSRSRAHPASTMALPSGNTNRSGSPPIHCERAHGSTRRVSVSAS